jgi:hypothetical protein
MHVSHSVYEKSGEGSSGSSESCTIAWILCKLMPSFGVNTRARELSGLSLWL